MWCGTGIIPVYRGSRNMRGDIPPRYYDLRQMRSCTAQPSARCSHNPAFDYRTTADSRSKHSFQNSSRGGNLALAAAAGVRVSG